jgi:hypothetical protein
VPSIGNAFGIDQSAGQQFNSVSASSSNGMSVAVWVEDEIQTSMGDSYSINAQLYNAAGNKVGKVIGVAGSDIGDTAMARKPAVGMDASGNFIVAWTLQRSGKQTDVAACRWTADGKIDYKFLNFFPASSSSNESEPSLAVFPSGDFVVSYTVTASNGTSNVMARQFNKTGGLLRTISVATNSSLNERFSDVAAAPNGQFDVVYQRNGTLGQNPDVLMNRYSPTGSLLGTVAVATSSRDEWYPQVAMDNSGNAVAVWYEINGQDRSVFARTVSSTGSLGGKLTVSNTTSQELFPSVAMHRTNGSFVVAYDSGFNASAEVFVKEISPSGKVLSSASLGKGKYGTSLSMNNNNRYFVTYTSAVSGTNTDILGRFGRL